MGVLPQQVLVSIKSVGAAATRNGQYKSGALPQREMGSKKSGALPQREMGSIKSGGAAATKNGQYRSEERRVGKECRSRWLPYH